MEKKRMICINCPMGCSLEADINGDSIAVTGNGCKRGAEYARNEIIAPKRIVTSTVRVENGQRPVIPVKTDREVPKNMIFDVMDAIRKVRVDAPVKIGDIVIENVLDTGANIVASQRCQELGS